LVLGAHRLALQTPTAVAPGITVCFQRLHLLVVAAAAALVYGAAVAEAVAETGTITMGTVEAEIRPRNRQAKAIMAGQPFQHPLAAVAAGREP